MGGSLVVGSMPRRYPRGGRCAPRRAARAARPGGLAGRAAAAGGPSRDRNGPCAVDAAHGIREDPAHGALHLDRRDQLRAGHGAREALLGGEPEERPLPPAPREHRRPHRPAARRPLHGRGGALRRDRQGLRDRPGEVRRGHLGGARGARPQEDAHDRHRGLRRARRDRPDLLRPPVLPRAGRRRGQALPPAHGGHARDAARGDRQGRHPPEGVARGHPRHGGRRARHGHAHLRRRDRRPGRDRRPRGRARDRRQRPRARDRQAARRVAGAASGTPRSTTTPTARRSCRSSSARPPARTS